MIYIHIDNCRDLAVSKGTVHTFVILICMQNLRLTASNCNCLLFAEQSIKCNFPVRSKCRWSVQTAPSWSWEPIHRLGELSSFGYVELTVFIKRMLVFWISVSIEYSKTEQLNKLWCTNNWISFVYVDFIYIYMVCIYMNLICHWIYSRCCSTFWITELLIYLQWLQWLHLCGIQFLHYNPKSIIVIVLLWMKEKARRSVLQFFMKVGIQWLLQNITAIRMLQYPSSYGQV